MPEGSEICQRWIETVPSLKEDETAALRGLRDQVSVYGIELQKKAAKLIALCEQPLRLLADRANANGNIASSLATLSPMLHALREPTSAKGFFGRWWKSPPTGVANLATLEPVLKATHQHLSRERETLLRDNVTLAADDVLLQTTLSSLEAHLAALKTVEPSLKERLALEDPKNAFLETFFFRPLSQRIEDLQTFLIVVQQGRLANEILAEQNRALAASIERAVLISQLVFDNAQRIARALSAREVAQGVSEETQSLFQDWNSAVSALDQARNGASVQAHQMLEAVKSSQRFLPSGSASERS